MARRIIDESLIKLSVIRMKYIIIDGLHQDAKKV